MNMLKLTAAAALVAASLSASAMTTIADEDLSAVAGQDGVSIAADLNINIGSFTYSDKTATSSGSVSFNAITVRGMIAMTIDVLNQLDFQAAAGASIAANGAAAADVAPILGGVATALGYTGQDVVQFAFPATGVAAAHGVSPTITVGSITTAQGDGVGGHIVDANGNVVQGASFGSVQIKNMDLQGTKVWMFGH